LRTVSKEEAKAPEKWAVLFGDVAGNGSEFVIQVRLEELGNSSARVNQLVG
jgi:hypothetical protein